MLAGDRDCYRRAAEERTKKKESSFLGDIDLDANTTFGEVARMIFVGGEETCEVGVSVSLF